MLSDLLNNLKEALQSNDTKKIRRAYKALEKVGVDKMTADTLIKD